MPKMSKNRSLKPDPLTVAAAHQVQNNPDFGLTRMPSKRQLATLQPQKPDKIFSIACQTQRAARPIVIGAGPAGILQLYLSRSRASTDYFERGRPVEKRGRDVSSLYSKGF